MSIKDNLSLQLIELDLLKSMYPGSNEIAIDRMVLLEDVQRFIDGEREVKPLQISFDANLQLHKTRVTLQCSLPHDYPQIAPKCYAKCDSFKREQHKQFNEHLQVFIEGLDRGELCMCTVLTWISDNIAKYITEAPISAKPLNEPGTLSRMWIYCHHIYRKELLKKIPDMAKEFDLSGFCLAGNPGIICIEGYKQNCDIYWQRLKYPSWKHISCKHREDFDLKPDEDQDEQLKKMRLFSKFEMLSFEAHGDYGLRNGYHMDLGQFFEFLKRHNCDYMYKIFFGL